MVSSDWYEAVIEKFGTVENFIDQLCETRSEERRVGKECLSPV